MKSNNNNNEKTCSKEEMLTDEEKIISSYKTTGSIRLTVEETGENKIRVKRVLITHKLWTSKRTEEIEEMRLAGMKTGEIAEKLKISVKTVQSYLPYTRGSYDEVPETEFATRSYNYRKRMRSAEKGRKGKSREEEKARSGEGGGLQGMRVNLTLSQGLPFYEAMGLGCGDEAFDISAMAACVAADMGMDAAEDTPLSTVYKVRFSLDITGAPKAVLKNCGKMERAIVRDCVLPGNMNLQTLHYVIQRMFNFMDAHRYEFRFPDNDFNSVTNGGSLDTFLSLCGDVFAFAGPGELPECEERIYEPSCSLRSWFKEQYTPPYDNTFAEKVKASERKAAYLFKNTEFSVSADKLIEKGIIASADIKNVSVGEFSGYIPYLGQLSSGAVLSSVFSCADNLTYIYDPDGDNWKIHISVRASASVPGEITPFCTYTDGLPVMERVGGPAGYARFLQEVKNLSDKDIDWKAAISKGKNAPGGKAGILARARDKGWTGKLTSAKNML